MLRQLLYISSADARGGRVDAGAIMRVSNANNRRVGVTGLLYTDGLRFLQVLEGEDEPVTTTFERIRLDPRHHAIVILSDRQVDAREFGDWAMAQRVAGDSEDQFDGRLRALLGQASPNVRATFEGLVSARRLAS